jgi:tetratricopeptide (TPR) repeat protein
MTMNCLAGLLVLLAVVVWPVGPVASQTAELVAQGRQALAANKFDEAAALFEKAVAADPNDPAALAWLGNAQVRKASVATGMDGPGWVKKGFNTMDEAVERFPNAYVVYVVRGIMASRVPEMFKKAPIAVKDLGTVIAMKEKAPAAVPDNVMPGVYLNLGRAYKALGQRNEARSTLETGKKLYPSAPETADIDKELRSL